MTESDIRLPAALLITGLLITGLSVWYLHGSTQDRLQREFDSAAHDAGTAIERRVASSTETLYGLRSLHAINRPLTRERFHRYITRADLQSRGVGSQAISFNRRVRRDEKTTFEDAVRNDKSVNEAGYPTFRIHPETENSVLYVIDYIEPAEGNETAMGFDLSSDPARLMALEAARDSGTLVATPPIRLAQETGKSKGFLLILSAYDRDEAPLTAPARRRAFDGFFAAVFRLDDMMAGVLGPDPRVEVEIYDAGLTIDPKPIPPSENRILFNTNGKFHGLNPQNAPQPSRFFDINVAERRWRIFATPGPGFSSDSEAVTFGVAFAGVALTLLVSGLLYSFARSRKMAVGIATDMTASLRDRENDLKGANTQYETMNKELEAMNQSMKSFLATAAHDLRTPLTSVLGFSSLLNDEWGSISEQDKREYVALIERQAGLLSRLIDDLLTLSRIEAGALEVHLETSSVKTAVEEALESYAQNSHGIEIRIDEDLLVIADPEHFRRIIANFVGNSVKYGEPPILINAVDTGEFVEITVRDQGEGVPLEFVPKLFNRFSRAETAQTRTTKGTGLGLSIVQGLARANGGDVWYQPNHAMGACFGVRLPTPSFETHDEG